MARIRTIKPEFCESESIGRLSRDARLLFILLWTIVDDEGRSRASSRFLASRLYPYDDDAGPCIDIWLEELCAGGHIRLYGHDEDAYLDIPKWLKHQKIDHPGKSRLPPFPEGVDNPREASRDLRASYLGPRTIGPSTVGGVSRELHADAADAASSPKDSKRKNGTRLPGDWEPTAEQLSYASDQGCVDPADTAQNFKEHFLQKPGKDGTSLDWGLRFKRWCRNDKNFRRAQAPAERRNGHSPAPTLTEDASQWTARLRGYTTGGFWSGNWGPRPEDGGSHVPPTVLAAWRASA